MTYTYDAIFGIQNGHYTVEFPAFGIRGRGCPGWLDTLTFAEDFLAEIILDWEAKGKALPPEQPPKRPAGQSEMPGPSERQSAEQLPPEQPPKLPSEQQSAEQAPPESPAPSKLSPGGEVRRLPVTVDTERYARRIHINSGRVFYDFETDTEVEKRNEVAFAQEKTKAILPVAAAAVLAALAIIVIIAVMVRGG